MRLLLGRSSDDVDDPSRRSTWRRVVSVWWPMVAAAVGAAVGAGCWAARDNVATAARAFRTVTDGNRGRRMAELLSMPMGAMTAATVYLSVLLLAVDSRFRASSSVGRARRTTVETTPIAELRCRHA